MKKPSFVKVFGQKYRVRYDLEDENNYGLTDAQNNLIHLRGNLQDDKQVRVFMHEVAHAVIAESLLCERKRFTEEEVCDLIGFHITDFLRDNPELVTWLLAE